MILNIKFNFCFWFGYFLLVDRVKYVILGDSELVFLVINLIWNVNKCMVEGKFFFF